MLIDMDKFKKWLIYANGPQGKRVYMRYDAPKNLKQEMYGINKYYEEVGYQDTLIPILDHEVKEIRLNLPNEFNLSN